jgi:LacI family transcriptional regulator, galactose operon repressor
MKSGSPTMKDVAESANVSAATVSRILNHQTGYTEETRTRVMEIIDRLGYKRNAIARGLVRNKTQTLGVLLPSVSSRFASQLLAGLEAEAHAHEYSAIICNTDRNGRRTAEYLRVLSEKQVDGLVFTSEFLTDEYEHLVEEMRVPLVLVATMSRRYPIPYVRVDDRHAAYSAAKYLTDKGHRVIGMVSGTREDPVAGSPRVEGFLQALSDAGVTATAEHIAYGDFHFESGRVAATELLKAHKDLTAVFAASDEMALGVISAAWKLGVRVPEDLSVMGYDDTQDAVMSIPPLTTVHQPIAEMGATAVKMLLAGATESKVLPSSITERDSVRAL